MSPLLLLAVALAGGVGSGLRYLADNIVPARWREIFPWGTALVNLTGSFCLGWITGAATAGLSSSWAAVLGVGLLGGYTTFSTASLETLRLLQQGRPWTAAINGVGTAVAATALGLLGFLLGQ